jgi:hypothetical protein
MLKFALTFLPFLLASYTRFIVDRCVGDLQVSDPVQPRVHRLDDIPSHGQREVPEAGDAGRGDRGYSGAVLGRPVDTAM